MEENNISLESQSAISDDSSAEANLENEPATAPQEQIPQNAEGTEGGTSVDDGGNKPPAPFMTVPHKHEDVPLTYEEATDWVQIGMACKPMLETVRRAAALKGVDAKTFIESFEKAQDEAYREELIAKYGEDDMETVDTLMEVYQSKKETKVKSALEAEQQRLRDQQTTLESRLATEFIELQKEFPEIDKFDKLPNTVKAAAANGQDLLSAYLRHRHSEQKKIDAAKNTQQAAKNASTGAMSSAESGKGTSIDALMQGLYG